MNLCEVHEKLGTNEQCLEYIEKMRWPDGVVRCPTCGDKNVEKYNRPTVAKRKRVSETRDPEKENKRQWIYICRNADCRQQFSPTSGTLFNDSHLPLIKWFQAIALVLNAKKGISAMQMKRDLGVSYKTAWYLYHRIREIMAEGDIAKLGGTVEIDETYVGGKQKGKGVYFGKKQKQTVLGAIQREGNLKLKHVPNAKKANLRPFIEANVDQNVEKVMTDQSVIYHFAFNPEMKAKHEIVNHIIGEYVRGDVYTNSIENVFSLFKRGIIGQYHKISAKHMQRYLDEFAYRFNRRKQDSFAETVARLCGFPPLTFASLISEVVSSEPLSQ
jgi:transposase-like protein